MLREKSKVQNLTQKHDAIQSNRSLEIRRSGVEVLMALVAALDRTVVDDFAAWDSEPLADHGGP